MKPVNIVVFTSLTDQAVGLLRYRTVPPNTLFLFKHIGQNRTLTTRGMHEPIRVVFMSADLKIIAPIPHLSSFGFEEVVAPGHTLAVPKDTEHVIEASEHTAIIANLNNKNVRALL